MSKKKRKLKKPIKKLFILLIFLFSFFIGIGFKNKVFVVFDIKDGLIKRTSQLIYDRTYKDCVDNNTINENNFSENTINIKNEIINYAKSNNLRYVYNDLNTNYSIKYNETDSIYGASLIKLVTAIYLLDNDVDLNTKIKYQSKYVSGSSDGMAKHKVGDEVQLKELMTYSISLSDNAAHHMIVDYIGKDKLRDYAHSLGATAIFTGIGDDYGNQTASDTSIYLKRAYELINTKTNGYILKNAMLNTKKNSLNVDNYVTYAHKYGSYNNYYHDIGINFDVHPYTISVLNTKGETTGMKNINYISKLTKDFNNSYYDDIKVYCDMIAKEKISK